MIRRHTVVALYKVKTCNLMRLRLSNAQTLHTINTDVAANSHQGLQGVNSTPLLLESSSSPSERKEEGRHLNHTIQIGLSTA